MTKGEVHSLLAQAQFFLREGNPQGAVTRAREAVMVSPDDETREEAELAVERYETALRSWREDVRVRESEHRVNELVPQGLPAPSMETARDLPPRNWGFIQRIIRPA
jgi:hypothetical protein